MTKPLTQTVFHNITPDKWEELTARLIETGDRIVAVTVEQYVADGSGGMVAVRFMVVVEREG